MCPRARWRTNTTCEGISSCATRDSGLSLAICIDKRWRPMRGTRRRGLNWAGSSGSWENTSTATRACWSRSRTLMLLGRSAEALALARSLEGGPDKRRHVVAAERAFLEGRREEALAALDAAAAGYGDAEGLYYIACEYAFFGALTRALDVFR